MIKLFFTFESPRALNAQFATFDFSNLVFTTTPFYLKLNCLFHHMDIYIYIYDCMISWLGETKILHGNQALTKPIFSFVQHIYVLRLHCS